MVACDLKPDIILANETWCNNNITNATLQIDGYDICPELRQDRKDTKNGIGGGLLCYVRPGLSILSCDTDSEFNQYSKFILKAQRHFTDINLIHKSQWPRELLGILFIKSDLIYGSGCKKASNWG